MLKWNQGDRVKLVLSGSIVEYFKYSKEIFIDNRDSREKSVSRARKKVRSLINANAGQWLADRETKKFYLPLFLTLTFADNVIDVHSANQCFTDFIARCNYHFFGTKRRILKYVAVIEFQKRGAVHYHVVIFNLPFISNLSDLIRQVWKHGFVMVNSIKDVRNVGAYVTKYMSKGFGDDRLKKQKMYFTSRGLIKPIELKNDIDVGNFLLAVPDDSLDFEFSEGEFDYRRHFIGNSILRLFNTSPQFFINPISLPVDNSPLHRQDFLL